MKKRLILLLFLILTALVFSDNVDAAELKGNGRLKDKINGFGTPSNYTRIYFGDYINDISQCEAIDDLSAKGSPENTVVACKMDNNDIIDGIDDPKSLYIQFKDKLVLNNASNFFESYINVITIEGLENLDTSIVTDMGAMFKNMSRLTSVNLSSFDTSKVKYMGAMFYGTSSITNLDLSSFNTSNVIQMDYMFEGMNNLTNLDLSSFDTSKVIKMTNMFKDISSLLILDISSFDTSNVDDMCNMFYGMSNLLRIYVGNKWSTERVYASTDMFTNDTKLIGGNGTTYFSEWVDKEYAKIDKKQTSNDVGYLTDIADKETVKVSLFSNLAFITRELGDPLEYTKIYLGDYLNDLSACDKIIDLSTDDSPKNTIVACKINNNDIVEGIANPKSLYLQFKNKIVLKTSGFFNGFNNVEIIEGLENLDTSKTTSMLWMFKNMNRLRNLDLSSFVTSNVTSMKGMFEGTSRLSSLDLSSFNTLNVTNTDNMFKDMSSLNNLNLSSFDTSNVTSMEGMFEGTSSLITLDLSSFDTSKVHWMNKMFYGMSNLQKIYVGNKWTTNALISTGSTDIFNDDINLTGSAGTTYNSSYTNKEYAHIDGGINNPGYLTLGKHINSISLDRTSDTLTLGKTVNLTVTYNPTDTTDDKTVIWTTNNSSVADVYNGFVTTIGPGNATITATVGNKTAEYNINVIVPLQYIYFDSNSITKHPGEVEVLTLKYNPSNTTDDSPVVWQSVNPSIATVSSDGVITARLPGTTGIIATVGSKTALIEIKVVNQFESGDGTENNPYIIKTPIDLYAVREDLSAYYELANDIDLTYDTSDENGLFNDNLNGWESLSDTEYFTGSFDGKSHKIIGLHQRIQTSTNNWNFKIGLFGKIKGTVKNLILDDVDIHLANTKEVDYCTSLGSLGVTINDSYIDNITLSGNIYASYSSWNSTSLNNSSLNSLAGWIESSTIKNITNNINITGDKDITNANGIAQDISTSTLENIYNYGTIKGRNVGGIVNNIANSTLKNAINYGTIETKYSGAGIANQIGGTTLDKCANYGTINAISPDYGQFGGLVAYMGSSPSQDFPSPDTIIKQSFNIGTINVEMNKKSADVGGLVGSAYGNEDDGTTPVKIIDCFNIGQININKYTSYSIVGGIVGRLSAHIENTYNYGDIIYTYNGYYDITHTEELVGAIVRMESDNSAGSLENSYYINKGFEPYSNDGGANRINVNQLTIEEAKNINSYTNFDFDNIWTINSNYPFPQLKDNPIDGNYVKSITITNDDNVLIGLQDYQLTYSIIPNTLTYSDLNFKIITGDDIATINEEGLINITGYGLIVVRVESKKINSIYTLFEINVLDSTAPRVYTEITTGQSNYPNSQSDIEWAIFDEINSRRTNNLKMAKELRLTAETNARNAVNSYITSFNDGCSSYNPSACKCNISSSITGTTYCANASRAVEHIVNKLIEANNDILNEEYVYIGIGVIEKDGNYSYVVTCDTPISIKLNETSGTKKKNEVINLNVKYNNNEVIQNNKISWSSDTNTVAEVTNGVVTTVGFGTARIYARYGPYEEYYSLTVEDPLTNIEISSSSDDVYVNDVAQLSVTYTPDDTSDSKDITWSLSDNNMAYIDSDNKIHFTKKGQLTVTATVANVSNTYTFNIKQINLSEGTIVLNNTSNNFVYTGQAIKPEFKVMLNNTEVDEKYYDISYLYNINPGKGIISVTGNGKYSGTISLKFNIIVPLNSISLNEIYVVLKKGDTDTLTVTYNPTNTTDDKTVTWTSTNDNIVSVVDGVITAKNFGTATITATVGNKTATCDIEVPEYKLNSISLNKTSNTLRVGQTDTLAVTYNPTNTTDDKTVTWSSNNNSIAKVENGIVTALKVGEATITAKVGNKTATYNLKVLEKETFKETIVNKHYKVTDNYVHGFKIEDTLANIKNTIGLNYSIIGGNNIIATGVQFKYNDEVVTVVVYGDLTGDGRINSADLLRMRQHLLGTNTLSGPYKEAASIASHTTINSADLLRLRQHLLGQKQIDQ